MLTVDVAIVNWNTSAAAVDAAAAFNDSVGVRTRVTIVDNSSRREQRSALFGVRSAQLLLAERNLGYGVAANLALGHGDGKLVCISNADVRPEPEALSRLCATALADPGAGMIGPVFGSDTHHYHSALPGRVALLARPLIGSFGRRTPPTPAPGESIAVEQVSGACFVMRREVWEEVGGFDEGYFLWYDDVDLAKRLIDSGRHNLVVGSAKVEHRGAGSFSQIDKRTAQAIRLSSLERYIGKHHARLAPAARPLLGLSRALRARGAEAPRGDG